MHSGHTHFPPPLGLTTNGESLNLYFESRYTLMDYFSSGTASTALAGMFFLKEVVTKMMAYAEQTGQLTRYPLLSLMFKLNNNHVDQLGVGFLMNDEAPLSEEYNNVLGNPFGPR